MLFNFKKQEQKIKFGISYSIFDGEELLEASIKQIRNLVDYINVVYQEVSWNGKFKNHNLRNYLENLKNKGLIDEIILFEPDISLPAGTNELNKRNVGLKFAIDKKCTHFMCMDTDEFYIHDEFKRMQESIIENNIDFAFCPILNYGTKPTLRMKKLGFYAVALFAKINKASKLGASSLKICLCDPTRVIKLKKNTKSFFFCDIQMHHLTYVRNDLNIKLKASSNEIVNNQKIEEIITLDNDCYSVENLFDIRFSESKIDEKIL